MAAALLVLGRLRGLAGHRFLADDVAEVVGDALLPERVLGHRHVTDAHLLAVARRHGARLATVDRGLRALGPVPDVVVIPTA